MRLHERSFARLSMFPHAHCAMTHACSQQAAYHSWKSASQSFLETEPRQANQAVEFSGSQPTATTVPAWALIVTEPGTMVLGPVYENPAMLIRAFWQCMKQSRRPSQSWWIEC